MITCLIAIASIQSSLLPLPIPSGRCAVGTTVRHYVDKNRKDPVHPKMPREIMVQYWYPTSDKAGRKSRYIPDGRLAKAIVAEGYYGQGKDVLGQWESMMTVATSNGKAAPGKWPVLLLEPGQAVMRSNYTATCQEAASHGYLVAAIDPPYGGDTMLPDGRHLTTSDDPGNTDKFPDRLLDWAGDDSFVLDRAIAEFPVDASKLGVLGHSMGGTAAMICARADARIRACANMDGMIDHETMSQGARVALLLLRSNPNYSDADLAKLGRTREQWEKMTAGGAKELELTATSSAPIWLASIKDTGHLSFSDAPFVMPQTITRFSDHSLDPTTTYRIISDVLLAFFDRALGYRDSTPLEKLKESWPQLAVKRLEPKGDRLPRPRRRR